MHLRHLSRFVCPFAMLWPILPLLAEPLPAVSQSAGETVMQLPRDQKAYQAALDIVETDQRVEALQVFLRDFPLSRRAGSARKLLLDLLLEQQPHDVGQIHELAQWLVDADKLQRRYYEAYVAYKLAEAPPNGVDLKSAEGWARDAVARTTMEALTAVYKDAAVKDKFPMPPPKEIHEEWATYRASYLQVLADVYFREGKLGESSATLDEAAALNPTEGDIFAVRGQIAHAAHLDVEAVDDLELAEIYGGLTPGTKSLLSELYAAHHQGDVSGLEAEIDRRYVSLPKAFTPAPHMGPASGRTVFVELFTGSACEPCVAADLGLDAVLQAYPRNEVVALSFDQHVPGADPLANPDSEARAQHYSVSGTPAVRVDGELVDITGGSRLHVEDTFQELAEAIDADLYTSAGISLHLTASLTPAHTIAARADVRVNSLRALQKVLTTEADPDSAGNAPARRLGKYATSSSQGSDLKLVLNFALVQKTVRYSGENGIRFHSMVVRRLAKPSGQGFPIALAGSSAASFTFDPEAVSASLSNYLAAFAKHNDRFAVTHFLSTDTSLPLDQLAVAAWVENPKVHHVVAAALVPLDPYEEKPAR